MSSKLVVQAGLQFSVADGGVAVLQGFIDAVPAVEVPLAITDGGEKKIVGIDQGAFHQAQEFVEITFPAGTCVEWFGGHAFASSGLRAILIPKTVQEIYPCAFWNCLALESVEFEEGSQLSVIPDECFRNCRMARVRIPDSVKTIANMAFKNCIYLRAVEFGRSELVVIGEEAFTGCAIERFELPASARVVEMSAFECCSKLREFVVSEDSELTEFRQRCFSETALEEIFIPKKCMAFSGAVIDCPRFKKLTVAPENKYFAVADEILYSERKEEAIMCMSTQSDVVLLDGVVNILNAAFSHCVLRSITVPASVRRFSDEAFSGCYKLESVIIGELSQLRWMGQHCFSCCGLKKMHIPAKVKYIGSQAFENCQALRSFTFEEGSELKTIKEFGFDATGITRLELPQSVDNLGQSCFVLSKLREVILGVALIPEDTFWMCNDLEKIVLTRRREIRIDDFHCPLDKIYVLEDTVVKVNNRNGQYEETDAVNRLHQDDLELLVEEIRSRIKADSA